MKILCIGHATYDITFPVDEFIKENTKNRVKDRVQCGGGSAANASYLLGKWGMQVYFAGIVGIDNYGKKIKSELESVNVDTSYLELSRDYKTTSSIIIANKSNGSRTILSCTPNDMKMSEIDINITPDIILMDGYEYEMSKKLLKKYPDAISIMDAGTVTDEIIELSKMSNYVVCSKEFAEKITGIDIDYNDTKIIKEIYLKLKNDFNGKIIVTLENMGALYEEDNKINIMKSLTVDAIDTTGAGDIFHGAFTYGIAKKLPFNEIIKLSNIAGAISTTIIGGRLSIPDYDKVKRILDEYR
ncbi:MAG: carbohydrate kinase family protein [Clostridium sp.]|nr:carbohydrate kinase family protein [Clostridium sp.]MCM1444067.1 carbohydrate kinase family protein [Candidatus Amulumruptor caecigallinarius]